MQFNSIQTIDKVLSGATIPGQSGPGMYLNKRFSAFPKALTSLEPHYHIV